MQVKTATTGTSNTFSKFKKTAILSLKQQKHLKGGDGDNGLLNQLNNYIGDTDIMGG